MTLLTHWAKKEEMLPPGDNLDSQEGSTNVLSETNKTDDCDVDFGSGEHDQASDEKIDEIPTEILYVENKSEIEISLEKENLESNNFKEGQNSILLEETYVFASASVKDIESDHFLVMDEVQKNKSSNQTSTSESKLLEKFGSSNDTSNNDHFSDSNSFEGSADSISIDENVVHEELSIEGSGDHSLQKGRLSKSTENEIWEKEVKIMPTILKVQEPRKL